MNGAKRFIAISSLLTLLSLLALPGVTYASLLCRSDPKVTLSNGVTLNIGVSIAAKVQDLMGVSYEVHVPEGVSMTNTIHTPGWATDVETFSLIADQKADEYYVTTTVDTRLGDAAILAYTIVKSDDKTMYTVSGTEDEALTVSFSG
jgi:hypothetical protein